MVEFDKKNLVCNRPPLVKDSSKSNLLLLHEGKYTFSASLPKVCLELYENIKLCELNVPEMDNGKKLSKCIKHSLETKGCLLYEKLKGKKNGHPKPSQTYLRVTLGKHLGISPGIPYVLEIWPPRHSSPIHNHGNANTVIKVLFGKINFKIFNKHEMREEHFVLEFNGSEGDITWLDRNWYQRHQLTNESDDFCATIQCYKYSKTDITHWSCFEYVSENSTIEEFLPNSDFNFGDMRKKVMEECKQSIVHAFFNYFTDLY